MAIRFSKLYTVGQNSRSNSTNFNGEMDNIYNSINTVDTDRSDLAGTGRTTETVKGTADALVTHKASSDHDTHNDTLYYRQSAVDSKVSDLAGVGRTTQTIKGNSDALTTHKASSDHDTHTDAMYYRQATVDSKDTTTLNSAKSYSDGNLTTHKSSSDHDTHTDTMYYRQSAVDTKVSDLAGPGRTTETIKGNYDALTTHKNSSDHDAHTDAMYYRQATVDSKINNASKTLTIASGTAFPSAPYTDGQVFWRSDLNQQFSYSGGVGAWLPSIPGNTTSHGASLNGVWHFDTDLYSTRGTVGTFTRASVANDPNTFASVASGLPRLTAGKYGKGVMIEEGTTNLVYNSDFETVTGTATVFSDPLTSGAAWTTQGGSGTYGAGGWTSGANGSRIIAGNAAWKPLIGSGGQNLALTTQASFTTGSTGKGGELELYTNSTNFYYVEINVSTNRVYLGKYVSGTGTTLTSVAQTISASTVYTLTLSLDTTGLLTAKLYSGTGTGGALLQTLTATDTTFAGSFLLGVGGDTGVVVSAASVTAPWANGWIISGDARVAWALTASAINGAYSMSVVGVAGVTGAASASGITSGVIAASTSHTLSGSLNTTNVASGGANIYAYLQGTYASTTLKTGTSGTSRNTATATSGTSGGCSCIVSIHDSGTAVFDAIQLEAKAYATSYLRNDSTSASATRNAETLTIPSSVLNLSKNFSVTGWYIPNVASSSMADFATVLSLANPLTGIFVQSGSLRFVWNNVGPQSTSIMFSPNDVLFYALTKSGNTLKLTIGKNAGALSAFTLTSDNSVPTTAISFGIGSANGIHDDFAVFNRVLTDAEISALYQSPVMLNDLAETPNWPALTNKPTTVVGYGIMDAATTTQAQDLQVLAFMGL